MPRRRAWGGGVVEAVSSRLFWPAARPVVGEVTVRVLGVDVGVKEMGLRCLGGMIEAGLVESNLAALLRGRVRLCVVRHASCGQ